MSMWALPGPTAGSCATCARHLVVRGIRVLVARAGCIPSSSIPNCAMCASSFEGLSMDQETIRQYGDELYDAWLDRRVLSPLLERAPHISLADAYAVQLRLVNRRVQAGETIIGKKIGLTSKPVQDFLGVYEPDFGQLTSGMLRTEDQGIDLDQLIDRKSVV